MQPHAYRGTREDAAAAAAFSCICCHPGMHIFILPALALFQIRYGVSLT